MSGTFGISLNGRPFLFLNVSLSTKADHLRSFEQSQRETGFLAVGVSTTSNEPSKVLRHHSFIVSVFSMLYFKRGIYLDDTLPILQWL